MLNKREDSDLETRAGDGRALTESNPAGSAAGFPPPPSCRCCAASSPLLPRPLLLRCTQAGWKAAEGTLRGQESIPLVRCLSRPPPLPACCEVFPELAAQGNLAQSTGKKLRTLSCLSSAHKHTFHLFCSSDSKLLNGFFLLFFAHPPRHPKQSSLENDRPSLAKPPGKTKEAELSGFWSIWGRG